MLTQSYRAREVQAEFETKADRGASVNFAKNLSDFSIFAKNLLFSVVAHISLSLSATQMLDDEGIFKSIHILFALFASAVVYFVWKSTQVRGAVPVTNSIHNISYGETLCHSLNEGRE